MQAQSNIDIGVIVAEGIRTTEVAGFARSWDAPRDRPAVLSAAIEEMCCGTPRVMRQDLEALDDVHTNHGLVRGQYAARYRAKGRGAMGLLQLVKCGRALRQPHEGFLSRRSG
jgi:hypothetical protein